MRDDKIKLLSDILNGFKDMKMFYKSEDHKLCYFLFMTMTQQERYEVLQNVTGEYMKKFVERMMAKADRTKGQVIVKNEPISKLLSWFCDKRSRKVGEARKKLRDRYATQSYGDQQKIITAFLDGSKSDRLWCYKVLTSNWNSRWEGKIEELWNKYGEDRCAQIVLMHLSDDFVHAHAEELKKSTKVWYCIRMNIPEELYPKNSMDELQDYVYAVGKIGEKLDEPKAARMLFHTAALELNIMKENYDMCGMPIIMDERNDYIGERTSYALWVLGKIGNYDTILKYRTWLHASRERLKDVPPEPESKGFWALEDALCKKHNRDIVSAFLVDFPIYDEVVEALKMDIEAENDKLYRTYYKKKTLDEVLGRDVEIDLYDTKYMQN